MSNKTQRHSCANGHLLCTRYLQGWELCMNSSNWYHSSSLKMGKTKCPAGEWQSENSIPDLTGSKVCIPKPLFYVPSHHRSPKIHSLPWVPQALSDLGEMLSSLRLFIHFQNGVIMPAVLISPELEWGSNEIMFVKGFINFKVPNYKKILLLFLKIYSLPNLSGLYNHGRPGNLNSYIRHPDWDPIVWGQNISF